MINKKSPNLLAAECLNRAREVKSSGDRVQLKRIAAQLYERARRDGQPCELVVDNDLKDWAEPLT
jgi:hypothetical protein